MKTVRIRSLSGTYFPAFRLNTKRYGVFLRIQSEYGKKRTRKTPYLDTFHAVFQLPAMSNFSLLSSEASLSSSDSLDSFSDFGKLEPYDFESTVSDNRRRSQFSSYANKRSWKRMKGKSRLVYLWKMQSHVYQCREFVLPWERWSLGWNS